jgi:hypothetical protein
VFPAPHALIVITTFAAVVAVYPVGHTCTANIGFGGIDPLSTVTALSVIAYVVDAPPVQAAEIL